MKGHIMKISTTHIALLGLAAFAVLAVQASTPAASESSTQDALIDTRLNAAVHAAQQDETVDTRLNFVIHSVLAKIDTLTNPGTLFLIK